MASLCLRNWYMPNVTIDDKKQLCDWQNCQRLTHILNHNMEKSTLWLWSGNLINSSLTPITMATNQKGDMSTCTKKALFRLGFEFSSVCIQVHRTSHASTSCSCTDPVQTKQDHYVLIVVVLSDIGGRCSRLVVRGWHLHMEFLHWLSRRKTAHVFEFLHPDNWFQKSVFAVYFAESVWTIGLNIAKCAFTHQGASMWTWPLCGFFFPVYFDSSNNQLCFNSFSWDKLIVTSCTSPPDRFTTFKEGVWCKVSGPRLQMCLR